ncbi:MAG TPA: carboxypeptidase-like regulatory domain-containing protein, partial [Blastocatellia bacterium]
MMLLLGAPALMAQTLDTATVRGQVTDPQGAAINDAAVTLANPLTGLKREARTDSNGYYSFAGLPLTGRYTLTVSSQGFKTVEREDLGLRADEAATINVALDVSQIEIIDGVQIYGT